MVNCKYRGLIKIVKYISLKYVHSIQIVTFYHLSFWRTFLNFQLWSYLQGFQQVSVVLILLFFDRCRVLRDNSQVFTLYHLFTVYLLARFEITWSCFCLENVCSTLRANCSNLAIPFGMTIYSIILKVWLALASCFQDWRFCTWWYLVIIFLMIWIFKSLAISLWLHTL